jgi:hypothetical protein
MPLIVGILTLTEIRDYVVSLTSLKSKTIKKK